MFYTGFEKFLPFSSNSKLSSANSSVWKSETCRSGKGYLFTKRQILEVMKLKELADNKFNIVKMSIALFDRVENTVGKGKHAG